MEFQPLGAVENGWLKKLEEQQNEDPGCRWIEGEPCAEGVFCGEPTKENSSYCDTHHARAYSGRCLKPLSPPKETGRRITEYQPEPLDLELVLS